MEERYRWYRTEMPNLLDDSDLSPSAYRLYGHIKRVAGDNGKCRDTTRQMADKCQMSLGTVSTAKKELLDAGFINVAGRGPHGLDIIEVLDIWPQNYEKYSQRSNSERCDDENECSDSEIYDASVQNANTEDDSVHIMNTEDRTRSYYEHNKKEQTTKELTTTTKTLLFANAQSVATEPEQPKVKAKKAKQPKAIPDEVKERRALLKTTWLAASGAENYAPEQVNTGIKMLDKAGCTPDELTSCHNWLKEDNFYALKTIYPQTIFKKLDEYRRWCQRAAGRDNHAGARPGTGQATPHSARANGASGNVAASDGASPCRGVSYQELAQQYERAIVPYAAKLAQGKINNAEYERQGALICTSLGLRYVPGAGAFPPS